MRTWVTAYTTDPNCAVCQQLMQVGQEITTDGNGLRIHVGCEEIEEIEGLVVRWESTLEPRGRDLLEEMYSAPLQRPVCPGCFLELPVSGVCGECA